MYRLDPETGNPLRVLVWGTYDLGKPRVRILLRGLRENGAQVTEIHREVWAGVEDKSQVRRLSAKLRFAFRWLTSYPYLLWRYLRAPEHDVVLISYLGQLDVLILWPLAKLRGKPIVWDAFLSLYDTVVNDRRLISRRHPLALVLWAWEWLACRAAHLVVLDTHAHGAYFVQEFGLNPAKVKRVFVGAETDVFPPVPMTEKTSLNEFTVLFYGQFIPLHGIETVVRAAALCDDSTIRWRLIGQGQEAPKIRELIEKLRPANLSWEPWVPYNTLIKRIREASVCLGIFGTSEKASRVIPNKVYQILSAGKPLITRSSPAIAELLEGTVASVTLVSAGDPEGLCAAIQRVKEMPFRNGAHPQSKSLIQKISPAAIGRQAVSLLHSIFPFAQTSS